MRNGDILDEHLPDQLLAGADGGRDVPDKVRWVRSDVEVERTLDSEGFLTMLNLSGRLICKAFQSRLHAVGVQQADVGDVVVLGVAAVGEAQQQLLVLAAQQVDGLAEPIFC